MTKFSFTPLQHPFPATPAQPAAEALVREIMAQLVKDYRRLLGDA